MLCELRRVGPEGGGDWVIFLGGVGGVLVISREQVYVTIISLCCTYRMLDLLLSIDMTHFSGRGQGLHTGFGFTWECV